MGYIHRLVGTHLLKEIVRRAPIMMGRQLVAPKGVTRSDSETGS
jgi:hypothetical protein